MVALRLLRATSGFGVSPILPSRREGREIGNELGICLGVVSFKSVDRLGYRVEVVLGLYLLSELLQTFSLPHLPGKFLIKRLKIKMSITLLSSLLLYSPLL